MYEIKDISEILEIYVDDEETILVGGQALNIWAEHFAPEDTNIKRRKPFFSADIDFVGKANTARKLKNHPGYTIRIPDMDTHTPMSAKVSVKDNQGKKLTVDYMTSIAGVEDFQLKKKAVGYRPSTGEREILVMHPMHCMTSRLENTYGILNRRERKNGIQERDRTVLAIMVMNAYLRRRFSSEEKEQHRDGYDTIEYIANEGQRRPALRAWYRDKVNILNAIPMEQELNYTQGFRSKQYPKIIGRIGKDRAEFNERMEKQKQRKDRGRGE